MKWTAGDQVAGSQEEGMAEVMVEAQGEVEEEEGVDKGIVENNLIQDGWQEQMTDPLIYVSRDESIIRKFIVNMKKTCAGDLSRYTQNNGSVFAFSSRKLRNL